jgi:uncharacterized membrane protein YkoI
VDKHRLAITSAAVLGVAAGSYGIASAASGNGSTTTTPSTTQSAPAAPTGRPFGHQRSDETVLTGDTASRVTAIATSKVPGGTVIRVETDADGNAAYEAHMIRADGTPVTVYVDKDFNFVRIETGGPGGPGGHGGPGHGRPDETVLTGDTASKVTAAAQAKVPGGTVLRVEADGDGNAAYEAHMLKADGTPVTVSVDKDFNVVSVETGGPGGHGFGGPGAPPQQQSSSTA